MENYNLEIEILRTVKENTYINKYDSNELLHIIYKLYNDEFVVAESINRLINNGLITGSKQYIQHKDNIIQPISSHILEITPYGEEVLN